MDVTILYTNETKKHMSTAILIRRIILVFSPRPAYREICIAIPCSNSHPMAGAIYSIGAAADKPDSWFLLWIEM